MVKKSLNSPYLFNSTGHQQPLFFFGIFSSEELQLKPDIVRVVTRLTHLNKISNEEILKLGKTGWQPWCFPAQLLGGSINGISLGGTWNSRTGISRFALQTFVWLIPLNLNVCILILTGSSVSSSLNEAYLFLPVGILFTSRIHKSWLEKWGFLMTYIKVTSVSAIPNS